MFNSLGTQEKFSEFLLNIRRNITKILASVICKDLFYLKQDKLPYDNAMASSMIPEFHFLLLSPIGLLLC